MKGKEGQVLDIIRNHAQVTKNDIVINKAAMAAEISQKVHEHYMLFLIWFTRNLVQCFGGFSFTYGKLEPRFKDRDEAYDYWLVEVEKVKKVKIDPHDDLARTPEPERDLFNQTLDEE
jgi:hypothetical protein